MLDKYFVAENAPIFWKASFNHFLYQLSSYQSIFTSHCNQYTLGWVEANFSLRGSVVTEKFVETLVLAFLIQDS